MGSISVISMLTLTVLGTVLAGTGGLLSFLPSHPANPAGPPTSYSVYGYVYSVSNTYQRTLVNNVNIWITWAFVNGSGGPKNWTTHSGTAGNGQYQFDLPSGWSIGNVLHLNASRPGEANDSATNSTTVVAGPGGEMDVLLSAPALSVSISGTPNQGESALSVTFTSHQSGGSGGYTSTWMFNDGSKSNTAASNGSWVHKFTPVRWYNVTMFLNDSLGDSLQSNIQVIKVVPGPSISGFGSSLSVLNNSQPETFTTTVVNGQSPYTFVYTFGINQATATPPAGPSPNSYTYYYRGEVTNAFAPSGTQANVSLTDVNGKPAGPSSLFLWVYNVSAHANAAIVGGQYTADSGQVIGFTGLAAGGSGGYGFAWRFGDGAGSSSAVQNPSHAYTVATQTTFVVRLWANDTGHLGNSVSTTVSIVVNPSLTAALVANVSTVDAGHFVSFNASAAGGSAPYQYYNITFGDGGNQNSGATYASHKYTTGGTYDARDCTGDSALIIACSTPVVAITVNSGLAVAGQMENDSTDLPTTVGYVGETMLFASVGSGGTVGAGYSYAWNFGDGASTAFGGVTTTTHAYATAGLYTVTYQIKDHGSGYATSTENIQITAVLVGNVLTSTGNSGVVPFTVTFTDSWTGGTGWYHTNWTFGDGGTAGPTSGSATSVVQAHTYTVVGNYTAVVVTRDSQGEQFVEFLHISVYPPLVVTVIPTRPGTNFNPPLNITYTAYVHGGSYFYPTYSWSFGNGNSSATHGADTQTYWQAGSYTATLTVTDNISDVISGSYSFKVYGSNYDAYWRTGWNLVALNSTNTNYDLYYLWQDAVNHGAAAATTVQAQNTGGAGSFSVTGGALGSGPWAIADAEGFWVDLAAPVYVGLAGNITAGPLGAATNLQAGWNTLGWILSGPTTAAAIAALVPTATEISVWNPATQAYTTYIPNFDAPSSSFNVPIVAGEGFLVYVPGSTSFTE